MLSGLPYCWLFKEDAFNINGPKILSSASKASQHKDLIYDQGEHKIIMFTQVMYWKNC